MIGPRFWYDGFRSGLFSFSLVDERRGRSGAEELRVGAVRGQSGYRLGGVSQDGNVVFTVLSIWRQYTSQILHTRACRGSWRVGLRGSVGRIGELFLRGRRSTRSSSFVELADDMSHQSGHPRVSLRITLGTEYMPRGTTVRPRAGFNQQESMPICLFVSRIGRPVLLLLSNFGADNWDRA